jgi:Na+/H+ antiporter NhaD/arsenite permease-like protein
MIIPFLLMLFSVAFFPMHLAKYWDKNINKLIVAVVLSIPAAVYMLWNGLGIKLFDTMVFDYLPFLILIGSLFVVTGGIFVAGDIEAKPSINTIFLGIGAVIASVMGTTGAAMLLIRPIIQTNKERTFKTHTILFFIAIVANCGGLLTPLGDPPLFLMYLRGAHFTWFLKLFLPWLFTNGLLLIIYFFVDSFYHKKESAEALLSDKINIIPIRIHGKLNFIWLAGIILAVAFINEQYFPIIKLNPYFKFLREAFILLMALISYYYTPRLTRMSNNFTWSPIIEVAFLFFGIFITMVPCILFLDLNARNLGVTYPHQFYYYSGIVSSFLDSAPAAVMFHSLALGLGTITGFSIAGISEEILRGICLGTVFFGSMSYIGNGPNFMIKAIAEENNIKMPHFLSYIFKFSLIVLLPVFILVQLIFISL